MLMGFVFVFVGACSKVEKNDHVAPTISNIRFNENMKIAYVADTTNNIVDTITLNPSNKPLNDMDTLLINYPITLSGIFESENGLSNIKIKIWGDTANVTPADTCFNIIRVPIIYGLFGKDFYEANDIDVYSKIPETMPNAQGGFKAVRTNDEYFYNVSCIDKLGNINDETYGKKPIRIITLQELTEGKTTKNKNTQK